METCDVATIVSNINNLIMHGITICDNAPSITHLLFADDTLLLLKANRENATYLRRHVLQVYEECSGQMINKDKLSFLKK